MIFSSITVPAHSLIPIGKVIFNKPSIEFARPSRSIAIAKLQSMLGTIAVFMVYCKKYFYRFFAALTFSPISIQDFLSSDSSLSIGVESIPSGLIRKISIYRSARLFGSKSRSLSSKYLFSYLTGKTKYLFAKDWISAFNAYSQFSLEIICCLLFCAATITLRVGARVRVATYVASVMFMSVSVGMLCLIAHRSYYSRRIILAAEKFSD